MKRLIVLAFLAIAGFASAQSVDWSRVRATCSSEISAYDAVRGTGDTSHQAMRFLETETGSPPSAAKLRALAEQQRTTLSDAYLMKTPVFRNSAVMYLCAATAALNQLQSGSTQNASSSTSRPSPPPPSSRSNGRNQPDKVAAHCIGAEGSGMRNTCNQQVNVRWCSVGHGPNTCGSGNLGWADVSPGGTAALPEDVRVQLIACAAPTRPTDIEYTPGSGFLYNCTQ